MLGAPEQALARVHPFPSGYSPGSSRSASCSARGAHRTRTQVPGPRSSPLRTECHVAGTWGSVHENSHFASRIERFTQPPLFGSPKRSCQ